MEVTLQSVVSQETPFRQRIFHLNFFGGESIESFQSTLGWLKMLKITTFLIGDFRICLICVPICFSWLFVHLPPKSNRLASKNPRFQQIFIPTPALLESPDRGARQGPFEVNTNRYKSFPGFDRFGPLSPSLHPVKQMRSHDCSRFFPQKSSGSHHDLNNRSSPPRCEATLSWVVRT